MFPSTEDTVYIYARACRAWYRDQAPEVAKNKIKELQNKGDTKGAELWRMLEDAIEKLPSPPPSTH